MPHPRRWQPRTVVAMVWARKILSVRGLTTPSDEDLWRWSLRDHDLLMEALHAHRLTTVAAAVLPGAGGDLELPPEVAQILRQAERRSVMSALAQAATAARIRALLEAAGIESIFIKGVFQADQSTGGFAARGAGDVDVLVAAADLPRAVDVLMAGGAVSSAAEASAALDPTDPRMEVAHAVALSLNGIAVDLHHRLDPDPHVMSVPFEDLLRASTTGSPGGTELRTLSALDSCAFVASHGARDNWASMRHVCDFALALAAACPDGDLEPLLVRAEELGVRGRVELALEVARVLVPALPRQSWGARTMARWAWSRHAQGRLTRGSDETRDVLGTYAFWILSERDLESLRFGLRRLAWLPSTAGAGEEHPSSWMAPMLVPYNATRRLVQRRRYGMYGRR